MPRLANDGRGRLGGRAKGTPNRPRGSFADWMHDTLNRRRRFIEEKISNPSDPEGARMLSALIVAAAIVGDSSEGRAEL